jgi:hypothetical protein
MSFSKANFNGINPTVATFLHIAMLPRGQREFKFGEGEAKPSPVLFILFYKWINMERICCCTRIKLNFSDHLFAHNAIRPLKKLWTHSCEYFI